LNKSQRHAANPIAQVATCNEPVKGGLHDSRGRQQPPGNSTLETVKHHRGHAGLLRERIDGRIGQ
jgi:hypothetical protein